MGNPDMGVRYLAAADAVEPVLHVRQRPVAARTNVDLRIRRQRPRCVGGIVAVESQPCPIDLEGAAVATELEPAVVHAADVGAEIRGHEILRELERGAY